MIEIYHLQVIAEDLSSNKVCFYSNFFLLLFLDLGFLRELILELGIEATFLINLVSYVFKFKIYISEAF